MTLNGFKLQTRKRTTVSKEGFFFIKKIDTGLENESRFRYIRVYLPPNYDFSNPTKRFKTLYQLDGQNAFDDYTSYLKKDGEWCIDEDIVNRYKSGKTTYICVAIDTTKTGSSRQEEMTIPSDIIRYHFKKKDYGYADKFLSFITEKLKPLIDETFFTLKEKEDTAISGASMGGLFSFYAAIKRRDIFGYSFVFSPAFCMYYKTSFTKKMEETDFSFLKGSGFYFCVGRQGLEKYIYPLTEVTYQKLKKDGIDITFSYQKSRSHDEKFWRDEIKKASEQWLKN